MALHPLLGALALTGLLAVPTALVVILVPSLVPLPLLAAPSTVLAPCAATRALLLCALLSSSTLLLSTALLVPSSTLLMSFSTLLARPSAVLIAPAVVLPASLALLPSSALHALLALSPLRAVPSLTSLLSLLPSFVLSMALLLAALLVLLTTVLLVALLSPLLITLATLSSALLAVLLLALLNAALALSSSLLPSLALRLLPVVPLVRSALLGAPVLPLSFALLMLVAPELGVAILPRHSVRAAGLLSRLILGLVRLSLPLVAVGLWSHSEWMQLSALGVRLRVAPTTIRIAPTGDPAETTASAQLNWRDCSEISRTLAELTAPPTAVTSDPLGTRRRWYAVGRRERHVEKWSALRTEAVPFGWKRGASARISQSRLVTDRR